MSAQHSKMPCRGSPATFLPSAALRVVATTLVAPSLLVTHTTPPNSAVSARKLQRRLLDSLQLVPPDWSSSTFETSESSSSSSSEVGPDGKAVVSRSVDFSFGPFQSEKAACAACQQKMAGQDGDVICMAQKSPTATSASTAAENASESSGAASSAAEGGDGQIKSSSSSTTTGAAPASTSTVAFARGSSKNVLQSAGFSERIKSENLCQCKADASSCGGFEDLRDLGGTEEQGSGTIGDGANSDAGTSAALDRKAMKTTSKENRSGQHEGKSTLFNAARQLDDRDSAQQGDLFGDLLTLPSHGSSLFSSADDLFAPAPKMFDTDNIFGNDLFSTFPEPALALKSPFEDRSIFDRLDNDIFSGPDSKFLGAASSTTSRNNRIGKNKKANRNNTNTGSVARSKTTSSTTSSIPNKFVTKRSASLGEEGGSKASKTSAEESSDALAGTEATSLRASTYSMSSQFGPFLKGAAEACNSCMSMGYGKASDSPVQCFATTKSPSMALASTLDVIESNAESLGGRMCACSSSGPATSASSSSPTTSQKKMIFTAPVCDDRSFDDDRSGEPPAATAGALSTNAKEEEKMSSKGSQDHDRAEIVESADVNVDRSVNANKQKQDEHQGQQEDAEAGGVKIKNSTPLNKYVRRVKKQEESEWTTQLNEMDRLNDVESAEQADTPEPSSFVTY
ncbi:unnamed protein product [Amoebophrya sp. A120]|nr:unnamed protein product [Amoebophrya sp. A120]|eukprot:GSA120T00020434001.1